MRPPLILIIDDSALIRAMLCDQLQGHGYRTETCEDGDHAVRRARELKPDAILLDVELPTIDGYGVLRNLKADPLMAQTPVVFLTSRAETHDVVRGLDMGAHDYLRKPFEPAELLARVSAAVRVKQLQDELQERNEELARSARVDPLTGLYNRRQIDQELRRLSGAGSGRPQSMGVLLLDVDKFKSINDEHGHMAGDTVLQALSARFQATVNTEDMVGRLGGDEFLILVPGATQESLAKLGERLRNIVAGVPIRVEVPSDGLRGEASTSGQQALVVTVSIGGATGTGQTPEALIRQADMAMYAAKQEGRNRVVVT